MAENECSDIYNEMVNAFTFKLMTFNTGKFWDQPSSYRLLKGLMRTTNEYLKQYAGSGYVDIDNQTKNLQVFLNCKKDLIQKTLSDPVASDLF